MPACCVAAWPGVVSLSIGCHFSPLQGLGACAAGAPAGPGGAGGRLPAAAWPGAACCLHARRPGSAQSQPAGGRQPRHAPWPGAARPVCRTEPAAARSPAAAHGAQHLIRLSPACLSNACQSHSLLVCTCSPPCMHCHSASANYADRKAGAELAVAGGPCNHFMRGQLAVQGAVGWGEQWQAGAQLIAVARRIGCGTSWRQGIGWRRCWRNRLQLLRQLDLLYRLVQAAVPGRTPLLAAP